MVVVMAILATAMSMFAGTVGAVMVERREAREQVLAADAAENFIERLRSVDIRQVWALYNDDPSDDPGGPGTAPGPRFAVAGLDPGDAAGGLVGEVRFPDRWVENLSPPTDEDPPGPAPTDKGGGGVDATGGKLPTNNGKPNNNQSNGKGRAKTASFRLVPAVPAPAIQVSTSLQLREDLTDARLGLPRDLNGDSIIDSSDHGSDYFLLPLEVTVQWRGRTGDRTLRRVTMLCELKW
ncbi:MAG: hypothetical protein AAFZ65_02115 [Planctomycetota bacterium]